MLLVTTRSTATARGATDIEALRDLGWSNTLRLELVHLGRVYGRRAALADAGPLRLRNAFQAGARDVGWFHTQQRRRACRGSICRRRCWYQSAARSPSRWRLGLHGADDVLRGQPVYPRDHQHVALAQEVEHAGGAGAAALLRAERPGIFFAGGYLCTPQK